MKSERTNKELEKQLLNKVEAPGNKNVQSTLSTYNALTKEEQQNSAKAISLVENFLKSYYESDSNSDYTKLINSEKFLSNASLRKLCPYDNDPGEISEELLQEIRNHDVSLINSESNDIINHVENLEIYYRGDSTRKEQVLAYFTVETYKKSGEHMTTSTYIFECTVGEVEGNFLITDILIKSPVIFPTYTPEESIKN